jgi:hypothetical protein
MESYNFDKIGKKMPYRVPDTFFDELENTIMIEVQKRQNKRNILKIFYRSVAVAATIALLMIVGGSGTKNDKTDFAEIAQAFDNLSEADQTYLLEIYQDDIFINE